MAKLRSLWLGRLPLDEAFCTWAIGIGLLVNLASSALFLALITAERPWAALNVGYVLSVPYNVLATIGSGALRRATKTRPSMPSLPASPPRS
jgi:hypothetical protein